MWGAAATLFGGLIKVLVKLDDQQAQQVTQSLADLLVIFGPIIIAVGRTRLQHKLNVAQASQTSPAPTAVEATPAPQRVGN